MSKKINTDIIISGGGIPALTLALLLARHGIKTTVIEPYPPQSLTKTTPGNHTSALMQGSLALINKTGDTWKNCAAHAAPLQILRIIDDTSGDPIKTDFEAPEIGQTEFGQNIPNNILRAALTERTQKNKNIDYHASTMILDYDANDHNISAELDNGQTIAAKLLIAADGRRSAIRELANIQIKEKNYGQKAITCLLDHSRPHDNISTEFHRPGGPFTLVPLPGNQSSLVWVEYNDDADSYISLSRHALERAIQERTRGALGEVKLISDPQIHPLISLRANKITAKRMALMAEAAHVLHPMGAQGLNLSLRDTESLYETIINAIRLGLDPGSKTILDQYEQSRRQDIQSRIIGTDTLTKLVCTENQLTHKIRRSGLKTIEAIPALKQTLMRKGLSPQTNTSQEASINRL